MLFFPIRAHSPLPKKQKIQYNYSTSLRNDQYYNSITPQKVASANAGFSWKDIIEECKLSVWLAHSFAVLNVWLLHCLYNWEL